MTSIHVIRETIRGWRDQRNFPSEHGRARIRSLFNPGQSGCDAVAVSNIAIVGLKNFSALVRKRRVDLSRLFLVKDFDPVPVWVSDFQAILVLVSCVFVYGDLVVSEPYSPLIHL